MKEINLRSYGKINLSLDVTGLRQDGYHQIETVMQRISLYDRVQIIWEEGVGDDFTIEVKTSKPYLPTDERNLAYKAAKLMTETFANRVDRGRIKIFIAKSIPVSAGLAGGSGNCAAVLIGLNKLWNLHLNTRELCRLGESMGSDIPFCVLTQNSRYDCALATGRGEVLKPLRKGMRKYIVLAKPAFGVSTKEVFKNIDGYDIKKRPDSKALIRGLAEREYDSVYCNMMNVLELYTLDHYEPVGRLKNLFIEKTDAKKVLMSGSGPTVFGIYDTEKQAKIACEAIRNLKYEAYWASTTGR